MAQENQSPPESPPQRSDPDGQCVETRKAVEEFQADLAGDVLEKAQADTAVANLES